MSGGEIALLNLARHLDRTRYEPLAALFAQGPLNERLRCAGVEVHEVLLDPRVAQVRKESLAGSGLARALVSPNAIRFIRQLRDLILTKDVDIVHTNSLKADILAGVAARLARRPLIWHVRDRIAEDYLPRAAVNLVRTLARTLPDRLIANSAATLNTLRLREGDRKGVVVHDGMEVTPDPVPYPPPGPPVVALVGRIAPWKGQHVFLEAAYRVRAWFPNARFLIVGTAMFGEQAYDEEIRAQCKRLGMDDVVTFTGFVEDVTALYGKLTVLVHASTTPEPFGQVVVEGMMAGRPVVATRGGGVTEIVVDGETGILVPMNDAVSMAEAIGELLRNIDLARAMGVAARRRAISEFSIDKTARGVEAVYDDLLREKGRAR